MTNEEEIRKEFDEKFPDPMQKKYGEGFRLYCNFCEGNEPIKEYLIAKLKAQDKIARERTIKEVLDLFPVPPEDSLVIQEQFISETVRERIISSLIN